MPLPNPPIPEPPPNPTPSITKIPIQNTKLQTVNAVDYEAPI